MFQYDFQKYTLYFRFAAGTSRGVLYHKDTYFVRIWQADAPLHFGLGEASILSGLSLDESPNFERHLADCLARFAATGEPEVAAAFPAIRFALETALADFRQGAQRLPFPSAFTEGKQAVPINGLIWMGNKAQMQSQIAAKIAEGYTCIKLKIGALDFEEELSLLKYIRQEFAERDLLLRVDANGAFRPEEALEKLKRLSEYRLHSIEQPIMPQQTEAMAALCAQSPLPIALDEELIAHQESAQKAALLQSIAPQYIILKPSLLGGFQSSREWIDLAEAQGIGWWITSALESNIGLNAIAQFTATLPLHPQAQQQGLGTGKLFHNNIESALYIQNGYLHFAN